MNPIDDYQDVLQSIEGAVANVWRENPDLNNYAVLRAYEAAMNHYRAEARQMTPKPAGLTGLDAVLYDAVRKMCEVRLGRPTPSGLPEVEPIPLDDLVACFRKLQKSVQFWTRQGGRQGYLEFINRFV